jgi:hypothetical protein
MTTLLLIFILNGKTNSITITGFWGKTECQEGIVDLGTAIRKNGGTVTSARCI